MSNEFASGDTEINREVALFLGRFFFFLFPCISLWHFFISIAYLLCYSVRVVPERVQNGFSEF